MRVSRLRAVETQCIERQDWKQREARIPTQAEDPETNYVISLRSPFNACIHLVMCSTFEVQCTHKVHCTQWKYSDSM